MSEEKDKEIRILRKLDDDTQKSMCIHGRRCGLDYIRFGALNWPKAAADEILRLRKELEK